MPYQDFNTFTELDPGADIAVTTNKLTFTDLDTRNTDSWDYWDFGANHFDGDFNHLLEVQIDDSSSDGDVFGIVWMLSNSVDDAYDIDVANGDWLLIFLHHDAANTYIYLRECDGGTVYTSSTSALSADTHYYIRIRRDEAVGANGTIYCDIYTSEADRINEANAVANLSITLHTSKKDYRYLFACNSYNDGTVGSQFDGWMQNLDIQEGYTKGDENVLPADDTDLETDYTEQNYVDVVAADNVRVGQTATNEYTIHQFKSYVGAGNSATIECECQTNHPPILSTVFLQIYNRDSTAWETVDSDNSSEEDTDFILTAEIADLTNYKDGSNVISCRVYQEDI